MTLFELTATKKEQLFANFIHGKRQKPAWLAARAAAGATASALLFGKEGTGKSHLLNAASLAAKNSDVQLISLAQEDFADANGLLVVDDLDRLDAQQQQALYRFFSAVQAEDRRLHILAASPVPPAELALRADVRTRLQTLPAFALRPLADRQLVRALCGHASRLGRKLAPSVATLLVKTQPRSLATLTELVERLDAHAIKNDIALSAAETRRWLAANKLAH